MGEELDAERKGRRRASPSPPPVTKMTNSFTATSLPVASSMVSERIVAVAPLPGPLSLMSSSFGLAIPPRDQDKLNMSVQSLIHDYQRVCNCIPSFIPQSSYLVSNVPLMGMLPWISRYCSPCSACACRSSKKHNSYEGMRPIRSMHVLLECSHVLQEGGVSIG